MTVTVICVLSLMAAACIWTAYEVFERARAWVAIVYLACMAAVLGAAWYSTYRYRYFANENTEMYGWPVPVVVFQREGPGEPWLDYLGLTVYVAFPINALLFAIIPSLVILVLARINQSPNVAV